MLGTPFETPLDRYRMIVGVDAEEEEGWLYSMADDIIVGRELSKQRRVSEMQRHGPSLENVT